MGKRLGLARIEKLMEELDRNIDLEGSDVVVNKLNSDTTIDAVGQIHSDNVVSAGTAVGSRSYLANGTLDTDSTGTVTQAANKSGAVTLSKVHGVITMHDAALGDGTTVSFTLTNTFISSSDVVVLTQGDGGTAGAYILTAKTAVGSATISVRNVSGGPLSEAVKINFFVLKMAT